MQEDNGTDCHDHRLSAECRSVSPPDRAEIMIRLTYKLHGPQKPDATLTLPWEQRTRSRLRVVLDNGREAGLFLRRGSVLRADDRLASEDGFVVRVCAAAEPVSVASCPDPLLMARVCYHLGNRHAVLEIRDQQIRYRRDPVLDKMVRELGLAVRAEEASFEPETGAYGDKGHHHG